MKRNNDYDNTFQTIKNRHKRLMIAIINDCFEKDYPLDAEIDVLPTRSQLVNLGSSGGFIMEDRDSDSILRIDNDYYLLEVQAYDDDSMAIRIAEYTFIAARDMAESEQGRVVLNIPRFTIIYIKPTAVTPRSTEMIYRFPDGQMVTYSEKNVFLSDLSKEEIIEKKLYAYIPFYIARYEKELIREKDYEKAMEDLVYFRDKMIELYERKELSGTEFINLGKFANTIVTHITDGNRIEREVTEIMGGSIVETESERLIRIGKESRQYEVDQANTERDAAIAIIVDMVKSGNYALEEAADKLGISVEAFREKMKS